GPAEHGWVERCKAVCAQEDQESSAELPGVVYFLNQRVDTDAVLVVSPFGSPVEGEGVALVDDQGYETLSTCEGDGLCEGVADEGAHLTDVADASHPRAQLEYESVRVEESRERICSGLRSRRLPCADI